MEGSAPKEVLQYTDKYEGDLVAGIKDLGVVLKGEEPATYVRTAPGKRGWALLKDKASKGVQRIWK